MPSSNTIGVVGLGHMGGAMAQNLVESGYETVGHDVDANALEAVVEDGVTPAESTAAVAARADILITSLPTPPIAEAVYLGDDGVAEGATEDLVALEMSTISPDTTRSIAEESELELLDAPVSGGPEKARSGELTVMVGGERETYERGDVQGILETLGEDVYHLGDLGAGHTTKLLNNQIGSAVRAASLEAAAVAAVQGVDWEAFMQVVRHSSGSSYQFRKRMPRVLGRDFNPGFSTSNTRKDVRLALDMADAVDAPTPITSTVHELYKRAEGEGLGEEDSISIVKLFEGTTGVPVESEEQFDDDYLDWKEI
jgi:3-hydroxyisobutyrate dehydrogenase-like beta-hydroxyacid dehydrogenase